MKKTVYIESSVVSYLVARPSRDLVIAGHQASTAEWWQEYRDQYEVFISPLVVEEISAGDPVAAATNTIRSIASFSLSLGACGKASARSL